MNKKYRVKFEKLDKMRFIGHLDLQNLFQRTIKKSKIPISYSLGFNPHQKMSFAQPLPLGYGSIAEYVDLILDEDIDTVETLNLLNEHFHGGLKIIDIIKLNESSKNSAAVLDAASYDITLPINGDLEKAIKYILDSKEILFERTTKKKTKIVDMRKDIYDISLTSDNSFTCLISSGSKQNLKPEVLIEKMYNFLNKEYENDQFKIKYLRVEMFVKDGSNFEPLDKVGILQ